MRGITTVAGNQTLDKTTRNALKILELAGRTDIPVAAGADRPLTRTLRTAAHVHGESGLDGPDLPEPTTRPVDVDAVDLLAELIEPGVVLVPTGPLTNVALLLQRHPDVRDRLDRIVWMGGAIAEGNVTPAAEFNAFVDPEAAAAVFAQRHRRDDDRARRDAPGAVHAGARGAAARHGRRRPGRRRARRLLPRVPPPPLPLRRRADPRRGGGRARDRPDARRDAALQRRASRRSRSTATAARSSTAGSSSTRRGTPTSASSSTSERFLELLVERIATLP